MSKLSQDVSVAEKQYNIPDKLKSHINEKTLVVRSPGRINLIGEHTDYNNGFVLPAAIDKAIYLGIIKRNDQQLRFHALDLDDHYTGSLDNLQPSSKHWPDYLLGVVQQLQQKGYPIQGFECAFGGDIPQGAGLSSSAALECAVLFALNQLFELTPNKLYRIQVRTLSRVR